MNVVESIKKHEGWRSKMYEDSVGVKTIGYGFNLEENELPKPVGELWLSIKIHQHEDELKRLHWYNKLDQTRQDVLLDMHYNLGDSRFRQFKKMIKALENEKYDRAADEMLDSKWARQVGSRAEELADKMRSG